MENNGSSFSSFTDQDFVNMVVEEIAPSNEDEGLEAEATSEELSNSDDNSATSEDSDSQLVAEGEQTSEESDSSDDEAAAVEETPVINLIKVKSADSDVEYEIPESIVLNLMVDNKETTVTLEELKKNYSGQVAWDKRFNELNKAKQDFNNSKMKEITPVKDFVEEFIDASGKGPYAAISVIAKFAGKDPVEFVNGFKAAARAEAAQYLQMDEKSREILDKNQDFDLKKMQFDRQEKERNEQDQLNKLQSEIKEETEKLGIDIEEFIDRVQELKEALPAEQHSSITPAKVGKWIILNKRADVVESVLREIDPELIKDESFINSVTIRSVEDNLDDNQTIKKIQSYFKNKASAPAVVSKPKVEESVKKVNDKIKSKQPKGTELKGSVSNEDSEKIMTFADLDSIIFDK